MRSTNVATVNLPSVSGNEWLQLRLGVAEQAAGGAFERGELAANSAPGLQTVELRLHDGRLCSIADGTDDLPAAAAKSHFVDDAFPASLERKEALLP
jgi:hypothetical protein